jgi:ribosomal protein L17
MARRKQNPIQDVADTVSAWLGGNRGTVNPQVQRTISKTKEAAKVVDQFATGGLGAALVSDAQRMAATGSSTPSALYKTAAVNLGAAAAGYGAAKVVQKTVAKVAPQLMQDVGVHFSRNKNITGSIKAVPELRGTGKGPSMGPNFEIKKDVLKGKTYKFAGYGPVLENPTKTGQVLPATKFKDFMSAQDTAYVTRSRLGRVDPENPALKRSEKIEDWFQRGGKFQSQRVTGRQRIVEVVPDYYDSKLSDAVTRARAQLAADRQAAANVSGLVAGLAPKKKSRGGGRNRK